MLKRLTFIYISLFFFHTIALAQNIDIATYKQTANYVIGYYVKEYIEKKTDKKWRIEKFQKEWIELENNSFTNPISSKSLESIINKLPTKPLRAGSIENIQDKTRRFYDVVNLKRDKYNQNKAQKEDVISELIELPKDYFEGWQDKNGLPRFQEQYDALKMELREKLHDDKVKKITGISSNPTNGDNRDKNSIRKGKNIIYWMWFAFIAFLFVIIWKLKWIKNIVLNHFLKKGNSTQTNNKSDYNPLQKQVDNKKIVLQHKDFERVFDWILSNPSNCERFSEYVFHNEKLCTLWVKSVLKYPNITELLEKELNEKTKGHHSTLKENHIVLKTEENITNSPSATSNPILYSDAIIDGFFNLVRETPNEDSVFELHLQNAQSAIFTIHIDAYKRVIANPSFLEGCDKQVLNNTQNINVEVEGFAQRDPEGKWKIIRKLSVIIN